MGLVVFIAVALATFFAWRASRVYRVVIKTQNDTTFLAVKRWYQSWRSHKYGHINFDVDKPEQFSMTLKQHVKKAQHHADALNSAKRHETS